MRILPLLALAGCIGGSADIRQVEVALGTASAVAQPMAIANLAVAGPVVCASASQACATYPCTSNVAVTLGGGCPLPLSADGTASGTVQVAGNWQSASSATATLTYVNAVAGGESVVVVNTDTITLNGAPGSTMTVTYSGAHVHTSGASALTASSSWTVSVDGTDPASMRYTVSGADQQAGLGAKQTSLTNVVLDPACRANPVSGSAIIQDVSLTSIKNVQIQFHAACDGKAEVDGRSMLLDYTP
jgi:hypothetical protein